MHSKHKTSIMSGQNNNHIGKITAICTNLPLSDYVTNSNSKMSKKSSALQYSLNPFNAHHSNILSRTVSVPPVSLYRAEWNYSVENFEGRTVWDNTYRQLDFHRGWLLGRGQVFLGWCGDAFRLYVLAALLFVLLPLLLLLFLLLLFLGLFIFLLPGFLQKEKTGLRLQVQHQLCKMTFSPVAQYSVITPTRQSRGGRRSQCERKREDRENKRETDRDNKRETDRQTDRDRETVRDTKRENREQRNRGTVREQRMKKY